MPNSRRKGANGERELIRILKDELGDDLIRRNLDQVRDGGCDILGVGDFAIEVKRCEKERLGAWMKQARAQAGDKTPVVIHRKNGQPWRAVVEMELDDFIKLVREGL